MFLCCWRKSKQAQYEVARSVSMIAFSDYLNEDIQYNNTVPFVPNIKYGKVIKVYDGDTITVINLDNKQKTKKHIQEPPRQT